MAGSLSEWFFTWGGFCGWYFIYPMVPGELAAKRPQKAPETTKTSKALGTPQKKNKETAKMSGRPLIKPGQGQKLGPGSLSTKAAASAPGGKEPPRGGRVFHPLGP